MPSKPARPPGPRSSARSSASRVQLGSRWLSSSRLQRLQRRQSLAHKQSSRQRTLSSLQQSQHPAQQQRPCQPPLQLRPACSLLTRLQASSRLGSAGARADEVQQPPLSHLCKVLIWLPTCQGLEVHLMLYAAEPEPPGNAAVPHPAPNSPVLQPAQPSPPDEQTVRCCCSSETA